MSVQLEDTVMAEIGFGNHYSWFNGSGSCRSRAWSAVRSLNTVLAKFHDKYPQEIAAPEPCFIQIAEFVCRREESEYSLTRTWQVCSDVIRSHIEGAISSDPDFVKIRYRALRQAYLGESERDRSNYSYGYEDGWGYSVRKRRDRGVDIRSRDPRDPLHE